MSPHMSKMLGGLLPTWLARRVMILVWGGNEALGVATSLAGPGLAVDVGANRGMTARVMARGGRQVALFEPNPALAAWLRRSWRHVHCVALGARAERGELVMPLERGVSIHGRGRVVVGAGGVEVRTLDSYGLQDVALVKIDVEGAEMAVLEGAVGTLRRWKPVLVVEIEARHGADVMETIRWIEALGYMSWAMQDGERVPARRPQSGEVRDFIFVPVVV